MVDLDTMVGLVGVLIMLSMANLIRYLFQALK